MENSIILHNLSPLDLEEIVKKVIKIELGEFIRNNKIYNPNELLTRAEACSFLKINMTTLWNWSKKGKIISYGIGNRVYYKKSELLESLVRLN
ncbi:helix-turn-helix domain-containing protein [Flavobacterium ginsenosidimutans]|uniref:Helix-turn-helix domain-containing protein n=1 Tax=Flavobacterium ginsenosidimutans TaxID=687844 RepID=A0ABZ2Q7Q6_9FLAO